jgi:hypothetical protein
MKLPNSIRRRSFLLRAAAVTTVLTVAGVSMKVSGKGSKKRKSQGINAKTGALSPKYRKRLVHYDRLSGRQGFAQATALGVDAFRGEPIRDIAVASVIPLTANYATLTVWRRDLSQNNNNPPPSASDKLLKTVRVSLDKARIKPNPYTYQFVQFDLGQDVYLSGSEDLIIAFELFDAGGVRQKANGAEDNQTINMQRQAGWVMIAADGKWDNRPLNKRLSFRVYSRAAPVGNKLFAAPSAYSAEDRQIFDWLIATGGGLTHKRQSARPVGRWPGGPTRKDGMGKLMRGKQDQDDPRNVSGDSALPFMRKGAGFGLAISEDQLRDFSEHPLWDQAGGKISMRDIRPEQMTSLTGYRTANGFIEHPFGSGHVSRYANLKIDCADRAIYGIAALLGSSEIYLSDSEILNARHTGIAFTHGVVARCYIHGSRNDAILLSGKRPKRIMQNYAHKLGQTNGSHADCIQTSGDTEDCMFFGNTFYMPYGADPSEGAFNEGAYGTTNVYNWNTDNGNVQDMISVNNLLIGGGYTVALPADPGTFANGMALIGDWFSKGQILHPGAGYTAYSAFYPWSKEKGRLTNVLIHNCRYLEDGSPVERLVRGAKGNEGANAHGLWNFDKSMLTPNFKAVCQILGYLDADGNPKVTPLSPF